MQTDTQIRKSPYLWIRLLFRWIEIIVVTIVLAVFVFVAFYAEDVLNSFLQTNLNEAVKTASGGRYQLTLGHIYYQRGTIYCKTFHLERIRYDSTETGITVQSLHADTAWFGDVRWLDLITGKGLYMTKMELIKPDLFMANVAASRQSFKKQNTSFASPLMPVKLPVVYFDSVTLQNIQIYILGDKITETAPSYHGAVAKLRTFSLTDKSLASPPFLFSSEATFSMPEARYDFPDNLYFAEARNIRGNLTDSVITVDSIRLEPRYSEGEFVAREKFNRGRTEFRCSNASLNGLDVLSVLAGKKISFRNFSATQWEAEYYSDKRKARNPHPPAAILPNDLLRSFPFVFNIDSVILTGGRVKIRERVAGSNEAGSLTFDRIKVTAHPLCTDTLSPLCDEPTRITLSAVFMGEATVSAMMLYPMRHQSLDLKISASVGPCSIKKLNPFLIPNERKEVMSGAIIKGAMTMEIRNGVATTTVNPYYKDLKMKILSSTAKEKRGILEGIKTFVANTFILRTDNVDRDGEKAISATTTTSRMKQQELLQFIWIAVRKSLGKVIGGFE